MKADKIIKELEDNYGYKFERDYFIKFKEYKQLIDDVSKVVLESFEKKYSWNFDYWDRSGKMRTIVIEALNEKSAIIIFKFKHDNLEFDPPY